MTSRTMLPERLDALFEAFDRIPASERRCTALAYHRQTGRLEAGLRKRLRSSAAQDRRHALLLIRELGWIESFDEYACQLAHDHDVRVRSLAVAMLAALPGATTNRILRTAINDTDDRVQANAIEALDRLNAPWRLESTRPKLSAPGHRVRANAIRSMIRLGEPRAFEVLAAMLRDPSAHRRLSALWVVERQALTDVRNDVATLALSDPDERVRERAAQTLDRLGDGDLPHTVRSTNTSVPPTLSESMI